MGIRFTFYYLNVNILAETLKKIYETEARKPAIFKAFENNNNFLFIFLRD